MTQSGPDARDLVRGNRCSYPTATHKNTSIGVALNEGISDGFCVIGVIGRVRTVGSNV